MLLIHNRKRPRGFSDHLGTRAVLGKNPFALDVVVVPSEEPQMDVLDTPPFFPQPLDDDELEDVIVLEERHLRYTARSSSTATSWDHNYNVGPKKQRTNLLPQLPHVNIHYTLPASGPYKHREVRPPVIPHLPGAPPCDDSDGYYKLTIGEKFAGRFVVHELIGQGTFGKVVSAYDVQLRQMVAVKIIKNIPKYREAAKIELRVLATLAHVDPANANHCIQLRECFDYRGHICLVTQLLKLSLYDFLKRNSFAPFPGSHIQALLKQLLRSVAFLHDLNLVHTDLKPENILLYNDSYRRKSVDSGDSTTKVLDDPLIQIIDFGSAIFDDEYHSAIVSTRHYRAPEVVLGTGWLFPCDLWSVGCILCELVTGEALFRTHENLEHLAMMERIVGETLPDAMVNRALEVAGKSSSALAAEIADFFRQPRTGSLSRLNFPNRHTKKKSAKYVELLSLLDRMVSQATGLDLDLLLLPYQSYLRNEFRIDFENFQFWWYFLDLLKRLLMFDPDERVTAKEALTHPWFGCGIVDKGTEEDEGF